MPPLKNFRHELFCVEYAKDADGPRAYRAAGYHPANDNTCASCASQLLKQTKIEGRILELRQRIATRMEITQARVLNELGRLAFSDVRKVVGENGAVKDPSEWDDDTAAAVAGIETYKEFAGRGEDREHIGNTTKLKLWDKPSALVTLAKHFKMLSDTTVEGDLNLTQVVFFIPQNGRDDKRAGSSSAVIQDAIPARDNGHS